MKHFNGVLLTSPLPFIQAKRITNSTFHRYQRFWQFNSPCSSWNYSTSGKDSICFTVNKSITLHGLQLFGAEDAEYTIDVEVKGATDGALV